MGQHLATNDKGNTLRRHLRSRGIEPESCTAFTMVDYGPLFPEEKEWCKQKEPRSKVAALEKRSLTLCGPWGTTC